MKFITLQRQGGPVIPVLFAGDISHADVAAVFAADRYATLSAGFVRFGPAGIAETFDKSVSLNLSPREQDAALIGAFYRVTLGSIGVPVTDPGRWSVLDSSPAEGARPLSPSASFVPPVPGCAFCPNCPVGQG